MQTLREIYNGHNGFLLNKWEHYIDIYDSFFSKYRNKEIVMLEIGVAHGGSLQMWRKYFGENALLIGVDINPECKQFETGNTKIFIGSQEDEKFLSGLKKQIPQLDILLDDGGHTMMQQIKTFEFLYSHIKEQGIYVCEDLHTSYWNEYGGGYKRNSSFIEYSKNLIDNINGWHARKQSKKRMHNILTETIFGLHFYDSMLFIEKKKIGKPVNTFKGEKKILNHQSYADFGHKVTFKSLVKKLLGK